MPVQGTHGSRLQPGGAEPAPRSGNSLEAQASEGSRMTRQARLLNRHRSIIWGLLTINRCGPTGPAAMRPFLPTFACRTVTIPDHRCRESQRNLTGRHGGEAPRERRSPCRCARLVTGSQPEPPSTARSHLVIALSPVLPAGTAITPLAEPAGRKACRPLDGLGHGEPCKLSPAEAAGQARCGARELDRAPSERPLNRGETAAHRWNNDVIRQ